MIITTLCNNPTYLNNLLDLIHDSFEYSEENSFANDFAPLLNSNNYENIHLLINPINNELVGHIGCLMREFSYNDSFLPVCFIGGVVIKKEFQKKGLFSFLFKHVLNLYKEKSALYILWGQHLELFHKFLFSPYGTQYIYNGNPQNIYTNQHHPFIKTSYSTLTHQEKKQIQDIFNHATQNVIRLNRNRNDWDAIEKIHSAELYLRYDELKSNTITSYFFKNKGQDLDNIIYEAFYLENHNQAREELYSILKTEQCWLPQIPSCFIQDNISSTFLALIRMGNQHLFKSFLKPFELEIVDRKDDFLYVKTHKTIKRFTINRFLEEIFFRNYLTYPENSRLSFISGLDSI